MAKKVETVGAFMAELQHARKDEVEALRKIILGANPKITEQIKWNAPSFCFGGDDRVTMRLQPKDRLELIFHRGAKVRDTKGFEFKDSSGLLKWLAKDRAMLSIDDKKDLTAKTAAISKVVNAWMKATA